jgi:hypothetical protein
MPAMATAGARWVGAALACAVVASVAYSCGGPHSDTVDAPASSRRDGPSPQASRGGATDAAAAATGAAATGVVVADVTKRGHALNGTVRAFDDRALATAVVRAEPTPILPRAPDPREPVEVVADATGAFDLRGLAAGDWALLVSAEGALRTFVATVRVPERTRFDLVLPRGGVIDGTVIDEMTHAPVAGARVRFSGSDRWIGDARTSADGRFRMALYDLIVGNDPIRIDAPGYAATPAESSVIAIAQDVCGRHEVTLAASRGHTLTGAVVGPDGPIAGANVMLWAAGTHHDPEQRRDATTDAAGRYAIEHLQLDKLGLGFYVRAEATGFVQEGEPDPDLADPDPPIGDSFGPAKNGWTAPDIKMRRRAPLGRCTIEGHVLDEEEHAVAGAVVTTRRKTGNVEATSGADGAFVLADVPTEAENGSVAIVCRRDGREVGSVSADTGAGAHVTGVQLFVEKPAALPHVRGKVAAPDGSAVAGARVVVLPFRREAQMSCFGPTPTPSAGIETRTASDGAFDVAFDPEDCLAVAVEAAGFAPWTAEFHRPDVEKPIDVSLVAARALVGRVVRAGTDVGVADLDVSLVLDPPADERASPDDVLRYGERVVATTAADGAFRVENAPAGGSLRVSATGWLATIETLEGSTSEPLRIEIAPALELTGRAEFADGRPCAGVVVTAHVANEEGNHRDDEFDRPVAAADDGSFACGPLPAGKYWLDFARGSPQVVHRVVGLFEAGTRDVRVALVLGRTIRGRVLRPDGTAAKGVDVTASVEDRDGPNGRAVSDYAGAFAVGGLDDGPYTISAEASGCFTWTKSGVRASGDPLELRLDEGLAVAGVLRDPKGETLYLVDLVVEPVEVDKSAVPRRGQTDSDGRFRIAALTRGRWRIKIDAERSSKLLPDVVVEAGSESLELRTVEPPPAKKDD